MITNTDLTVFHKGLDPETRLETWTRYYYSNVWWFDKKGTSLNAGYTSTNDVQIRIPYNTNENADISNFGIGDILYRGNLEKVVEKQSDVPNAYNITSITDNQFGNEPHIHIGGA